MRHLLLLFVSLFLSVSAFTREMQNDSINITPVMTDPIPTISTAPAISVIDQENEKQVKIHGEVLAKTQDRYKIYPTPNMYSFLKLDTQTGRVYRVQWNIDKEKRFESYVSPELLVSYDENWTNGRFEIYTTTNIYTFLLLDKIDGRVWQGQWGSGSENMLLRIY